VLFALAGALRNPSAASAQFTNALIGAISKTDQANAAVDDSVSFTEICQVSGTNIQLDSITNHARLEGLENAALVGNAGNNVLTGNAGNNSITGGTGRDIITGGTGADRFLFNQPTDSQLGSGTTGMDWIRDFEIGTDTVVSPWGSEVQQARLAGSVTKLTGASVTQLLDATTFSANVSAVAFTLGDANTTRTFLALNNGVGGFDASADVLLEITGYQGMLSF
jgi:Ca2+-binding RTX toxin-like protein